VTIGPLALLFCGLYVLACVCGGLVRSAVWPVVYPVSFSPVVVVAFLLLIVGGEGAPYDPMDQLRVSSFNRYLPTERENGIR
jgi:hypothetical protein